MNHLSWFLFGRFALLRATAHARVHWSSLVIDSQLDAYAHICRRATIARSTAGRFLYCAEGARIEHCRIGNFVSISPQAQVGGLGRHPIDSLSTHHAFYSQRPDLPLALQQKAAGLPNEQRQTIIGNDVWIGMRAVIMNGITIGNGAIIGAGTIVTKDVAPYTILAGIPGRPIRRRFSELEADAIERSHWWNWSIEELARCAEAFDESPGGAIRMLEHTHGNSDTLTQSRHFGSRL